ncbi:DUF6308 family protein [Arthrobacter sp. GCM10027362]|uniref:DUF6308 family protein n=1 Tax=Arthrobacter sp. GCM10027362 TaxID=3273379 RepID=UPI003625B287
MLALKRPHLIPIWDSVVANVAGLQDSAGYWHQWHGLLSEPIGLRERLVAIRQKSSVPHRYPCCALWMLHCGCTAPRAGKKCPRR